MATSASKKGTSKVSILRSKTEEQPEKVKPTVQLRLFRMLTKFLFLAGVWTSVVLVTQLFFPLMAQLLAKMSGIQTGAPFDAMIATWLLPLVFVAGLMLWFEIVGIKWLWSKIQILDQKAAEWPLMKPYDKTTSSSRTRRGKAEEDSDVA